MSNGNLSALLASFDDEAAECDGAETTSDTFFTAYGDPDQSTLSYATCQNGNESLYQEALEEQENSFADEIDLDETPVEMEGRPTLASTISTQTTPNLVRVRDLIASAKKEAKTPESPGLDSNSFPYSSFKLSNNRVELTKKASEIGKAISDAPSDGIKPFHRSFGIRIKNPKLTESILSTYCTGFTDVRLGRLSARNPPQGDWWTMGVIVEKSEYRKSANGNEYMSWKLSDLSNLQDTPVRVLLFGECLKQHWKLQQSAVVALTSPQFGDSRDDKCVTLRISKAAQVIDLGFCPDFGTCNGSTADGRKCSNYVNVSNSEYCIYHVHKAAKSVLFQRSNLSSQYNSPIMSKVPNFKLCGTSGPPPLTNRSFARVHKNAIDPEALNAPAAPTGKIATKEEIKLAQDAEKKNLEAAMMKKTFSVGGRNFLKYKTELKAKSEMAKSVKAEVPITASKPLPDFQSFLQQQSEKTTTKCLKAPETFIELTESRPSERKTLADINRQKLIAKIRKDGGLAKADPNRPFKRSADESTATSTASASVGKENEAEGTPSKRSKLGGPALSSDDIKALLGRKSTHEKAIEDDDREREAGYFKAMEVREKIETRLTELTEIKNVRVITCKKCNYTSEKQSTFCMMQGHAITRHTANKRFFKCAACKQRVTAFAMLVTKPCEKCGCTSFDRVGVRDERVIGDKKDKLVVRGEERKYVNR